MVNILLKPLNSNSFGYIKSVSELYFKSWNIIYKKYEYQNVENNDLPIQPQPHHALRSLP